MVDLDGLNIDELNFVMQIRETYTESDWAAMGEILDDPDMSVTEKENKLEDLTLAALVRFRLSQGLSATPLDDDLDNIK